MARRPAASDQQVNGVEMIPLEQITVLNPRSRNRKHHQDIVDNIEAVGLKRPITVRRRSDTGEACYDLVCGQGRFEAFKQLGQREIPAVIVEAEEDDCLVMSLVENIARRQHRPIDLMAEVGALHSRGYSDMQISQKIGRSANWVYMVVQLLEKGEQKLLDAVETGLMPITLAIDISRAHNADAQNVLLEAFEAGKLRGKRMGQVRRLLDQRMRRHKGVPDSGFNRKAPQRRLSSADLMRLYESEAERQRILVKKSDFTQARLLFLIEALKDLIADEAFCTLLRAESLSTMPRVLAARVGGNAFL
jgi:ParB family chromosome partitioning protein